MQHLKLHILQLAIVWENASSTLEKINPYLNAVNEGEILILPETFATGFSMNRDEVKQTMAGSIVTWMKEKSMNRVICGSVFIEENGKVYNRFIWCQDGAIKYTYDKAHLFSLGNEDKHYTAGKKNICIAYKGWRIRPFICYDLRFPVWNRNASDIDLYIYVANWPEARKNAWQKLLEARAIENQVYVAASNCVGTDGNGVKTIGMSGLIDFEGHWLAKEENEEVLTSIELDRDVLHKFRQGLPFLKDGDSFTFV